MSSHGRRAREVSGSFTGSLIAFMRASPFSPDHHPKVPSLNMTIMEVKASEYEVWEDVDIQSITLAEGHA